MQVVVKKPHTDFKITGKYIPEEMLEIVRNLYGNEAVSVKDDEYVNLHDTDIYKEAVSEQTPSYNLRFYRKLNGLTQKELADELGIAKQYVSNMETGERSISRQMAKNLAEIFKVSPARFI